MRKQTRYLVVVIAIALAASIAVSIVRLKAPPDVARLLPESDAIAYLNVKPIRSATHFDRTPVQRSPDFQQFIDATGIVPERDLDAAAFALHRMADPRGPNGLVAFSEVFEGRFDGTRLARYLAGLAGAPGGGVESYASHTIYTIPIEGRSLRVAQLGSGMLAASNMPTAEQIHGMIDRERNYANPFSAPSLLKARYADVPVLSSAWAVGRIGLPFAGDAVTGDPNHISLFGLQLPFTVDAEFVASMRFTNALHLRVEEIAASDADAARSASQMTTMLKFLRTLEQAQANSSQGASLMKVTDSIQLEQDKNRAVMTATIPTETLKALFQPSKP